MALDLAEQPDTVRTRRSAARLSGAAAALVALPVVVGVVLATLPADADARVTGERSARLVLEAVDAHPLGSWLGLLLAAAAYLVAAAALKPIAVAASGRFALIVRIGYAGVVIGSIGLAMANAAVAVSLRAAADPEVSRAASTATQIALQHDQGPLFPLFLAGLGSFVGGLLLVVGSALCKSVAWWQGLVAGAVAVGLPLAAPGASGLLYLAITVAAAVALMPLTAPARAARTAGATS